MKINIVLNMYIKGIKILLFGLIFIFDSWFVYFFFYFSREMFVIIGL